MTTPVSATAASAGVNPPAPGSSCADLDDRLARFEHAWQTRPPAALLDFLPPEPAQRRPFLLDAIPIDLEYRWCRFSAGGDFLKGSEELPSHPLLDDYLRRHLELGAAAGLPAALIGEEYRVRCWASERPAHADYLLRFPVQAARLGSILTEIDRDLVRRPATLPPQASEASLETSCDVAVASVAALVSQLETLPFLSPTQRAQLRPLASVATGDAIGLARTLVERGWLTPFQADFLLRGRGSKLVVGAYVLLDRIGSGWSSQVFRARQISLNRVVALKLFRRELLEGMDESLRRRFYQEMQAVGRLSHPHVVHAYDAGPAGATLFIAMEYLSGIDLHRLVEQKGPLPVEQALDYTYQAALGLQHAFEHGLVHRDVKPSNLLVTHSLPNKRSEGSDPSIGSESAISGTVKVLDLGLARIHQAVTGGSGTALTRTGWLMGTADFMAPEQGLDPHGVDVRSDVYGLGCTLFYVLTGRPVFPGGTFLQKLNRHREAPPPPLETLRPDVPPAVAAVVARMLQKRPEQRWATPAAVCTALAGVLSQLRQRPAPVTPLPAAAPRSMKSALWLSAGLAATLGLAAIAAGTWLFLSRADPRQKPGMPAAKSAETTGKDKPTSVPQASPFQDFEGIWFINYTNDALRIYLVDARGRVYFTEGRVLEGQLRVKGNEVLLSFPGDEHRLERVRLAGGRWIVDHFNPANGYPDNPLCTGIGERKHSLAHGDPTSSAAYVAWAGAWVVRYANGLEQAYLIDEQGHVWSASDGTLSHAQIEPKATQVSVLCGDRYLERLKLYKGGMQVQRFEPPTEYPSKVTLRGGGARRE